jgi:hypothetical protein
MRQQFNADLLIRNLGNLDSGLQATKLLSIACSKMRDIQQTGPETFVALGWEFRVGNQETVSHEDTNLKLAQKLKVKCSPKTVLYRENSDGTATLVTCVPGCAFRNPISCFNEIPQLNSHAQSQFVEDINILAVEGWYHPLGLSGYTHWYLHPSSTHIILGGWESMRPIAEREQGRLVEVVTSLFESYERQRKRIQASA